MSKTVEVVLIAVGLGALIIWWTRRNAQPDPQVETGPTDPCGGGVLGTIGGFIKGHVDRKNTVAPLVASAYVKAPPAQLAPLTNIAGKLDVSQYAEKYIGDKVGNALCSMSIPSISAILGTAGGKIQTATSGGVKLGTEQLKAGTIAPATDLYHAGTAIARGDIGGAATAVGKSIVDGPKAAYTSTKNFITSLF